MKCSKIEEKFFQLENYEILPIRMQLHLLFCKKCRNMLLKERDVLLKLQKDALFKSPDLTKTIMQRVKTNESEATFKESAFWPWLCTGFIIILSTVFLSFSKTFITLKKYFGPEIEIPMYICFAVIITGFSAIFVGTHLERMKRIFNI